MATKKFKELPKKAQRAAFAEMDEDGTRQNRGSKSSGGGVVTKTLKASKAKLPHIKNADQSAMLDKSMYHFSKGNKGDKERMLSGLDFGVIKAEQTLRSRERNYETLKWKKESKEFLSTARAFKLKTAKPPKK